nr:tyrosine recombinase XerC 2-like [Nerophis lumbriciformis]
MADPQGFGCLTEAFLDHMEAKNYSEAERGLTRPDELTKPHLERYQRHLFHHRKADGNPLSIRTHKNNHILSNPASELELPRLDTRLPKAILTIAEAEKIMACVDTNQPNGIRDRAVLETLYSTGMRRAEACGLNLYDLDRERGTIMIRQGKGKKDRLIPIGERATAWIDKYLAETRPLLVREPDDGTLFLTSTSQAYLPEGMSKLARKYVKESGIGKSGSCHLFRHTMATLMLEGGADIRFIQQMLGHKELSTTEIYTHVSIQKLKEIHDLTHPAKLKKSP